MENIIDAKRLGLEEWLKIILSDKYNLIHPNNCFPTNEHLNSYLDSIDSKSDIDVKNLMRRFLVKTGTYGSDLMTKQLLISKNNKSELQQRFNDKEYFRRLILDEHVWEGVSWVLDLLPNNPDQALNGLNAYFAANCLFFPDFVLNGMSDSLALIRAKFIEYEYPQQVFLNLTPIEFEKLVQQLYIAKGYKTNTTKITHDGGVDIIATKTSNLNTEKLLIQYKRYTNKITVTDLRELSGVMQDYPIKNNERVTKAVMVCSTEFTRDVKKEFKNNHAIELIDYKELSKQLNQFKGRYWLTKIDRFTK